MKNWSTNASERPAVLLITGAGVYRNSLQIDLTQIVVSTKKHEPINVFQLPTQ